MSLFAFCAKNFGNLLAEVITCMLNHTKCPSESKALLFISNNEVSVKVSVIFSFV